MTAYTDTVDHRAEVYSLGAPDDPLLRASRKADFLAWLDRHDAGVAAKTLRDAAKDAHTRGDIGHTEGVTAERWLTVKANLIEGHNGFDHCPGCQAAYQANQTPIHTNGSQ